MTRIIFGIIAGLVLGAAATWTLLKHGEHEEKNAGAVHGEESRVIHTNAQTIVRLDREAQEKAGLQLTALQAAARPPELNVFGRVQDPSPLAAIISEIATATTTFETSRKELERLQILAKDQNTSSRLLEAAGLAVQRDQIAANAAHLKLVSGWGKAIAGEKDLPALVAALVAQDAALVRVDVPLGDIPQEPPTGARIATLNSPESPSEARLLGPAPNADSQTQGQGYLCLVTGRALTPGAAVTCWLTLPGQIEAGVVIPRSAIVRHQGESFVYVQTAPDQFLRKEVELQHPATNGWFTRDGLKPGDRLVTVGAQQLLSEELKGEGGEEE